MKHTKRELWMGIVLLVLSAAYFAGSFSIPAYNGYGNQALDSKFMPRLLAVLMAVLCIIHIVSTMLAARRHDNEEAEEPGELTAEDSKDARKHYDEDAILKGSSVRDILIIAVLLFLYVALFSSLGFVLSSILFLFCSILFLTPAEKRNWFWIIGLSVAVPLAVYFLFVSGFKLRLPSGILNF